MHESGMVGAMRRRDFLVAVWSLVGVSGLACPATLRVRSSEDKTTLETVDITRVDVVDQYSYTFKEVDQTYWLAPNGIHQLGKEVISHEVNLFPYTLTAVALPMTEKPAQAPRACQPGTPAL